MPANPATSEVERIARGLTKAQRELFRLSALSPDGNPWQRISMSQRAGGATDRTFEKLKALGLFDRGNCPTPLGLQVRAFLQAGAKL